MNKDFQYKIVDSGIILMPQTPDAYFWVNEYLNLDTCQDISRIAIGHEYFEYVHGFIISDGLTIELTK